MAAPFTYSTWQRAFAAISYGVVSTTITLFNKAVFHVYNFKFPNILTTCQIVLSILMMLVLRGVGVMKFEPFATATARRVMPLTLCWWIYVVSGVTALQYLSVPMFSVLRRIGVVPVLIGEYLAFNKVPTRRVGCALAVMMVGAMVATATDLTYSAWGYVYVGVCVVSTAVYLILIRKLKADLGLSEEGLLYYNNVLALGMMVTWTAGTSSEFAEVGGYEHLRDPWFLFFLALSCSQALLLNICIFRCTTINSPLATTVTGNIKDVALTTLGIVLFGDVQYHAINFLGLGLAIAGGIMYSAFSYLERHTPQDTARTKELAGGTEREKIRQ